jgi:AcrR family transcriptional regulator
MAMRNNSRVTERKQDKRAQARGDRTQTKRVQARGDRTQALVVDETLRCVREEGFAAASTRRILERAGVSWGVIQYHFGDRDGLLAAVIEYGITRLVDALDAIVDDAADIDDGRTRAEMLTSRIWSVLSTPECMATLEILINTRSKRGTLDANEVTGLQSALARLSGLLGEGAAPPLAIANLLWASALGMMVAQMSNSAPVPTHDEQQAMADVITDRLSARRRRRPRA